MILSVGLVLVGVVVFTLGMCVGFGSFMQVHFSWARIWMEAKEEKKNCSMQVLGATCKSLCIR